MSWIRREIAWLKSKVIYEWFPGKAKRKLAFYSQLVGKGDLCYDIGAHLGDRTTTFLHLGASVIAIDPQPRFFQYLQDKFKSKPQITILPVAVGDHVGRTEFYISNHHPTLSTLSGEDWRKEMNAVATYDVEYDETTTVDLVMVDTLIESYGMPQFIKIDVEGFELQVLKGLSQCPNYLSIEFLSFDLKRLKECLERLSEMGYREFNWSYKETFKWAMEEWQQREALMKSIAGYESGIFSGDVYARKSKS